MKIQQDIERYVRHDLKSDFALRAKILGKISEGQVASSDIPEDIKEEIMRKYEISEHQFNNVYIDLKGQDPKQHAINEAKRK